MMTALLAIALVGVFSVEARADVSFGPHDVPTIFFVSKSDDRNRVDYGIRLNARCMPEGDRPIVVYWRTFEGGLEGRATHGLNFVEQLAYGVDVADLGQGVLRLRVRALPRTIIVSTSRRGSECAASATTSIDGAEAELERVHLTLAGPGRAQHADLFGRVGDRRVHERFIP
jgi:hypothetical protein